MKKWEYLTVNVAKVKWEDKTHISASPEISKLGAEGWELVCATGIYLFFKREKAA